MSDDKPVTTFGGMPVAPYQAWARETLGFEFDRIELLITALTHRSYVNEHKKSTSEHNERLEFLGDAVLELVVTDFLFTNYAEPEGILTSWRAALVRTESIAEAGLALGYESLIRMSKGEKAGSDRARQQIRANAFEAVLGSIYLEKGYEECRKAVPRQNQHAGDHGLGHEAQPQHHESRKQRAREFGGAIQNGKQRTGEYGEQNTADGRLR